LEPLRFSNEKKLRKQMQTRGWTEVQIHEALATAPLPATGKRGPALRYQHPISGKSVVVDAATGEIFHIGREGFLYG
jgi:hypothetical protein